MWNACNSVILEHYADFAGRARRSEFWWFYLAYIIVLTALSILGDVNPVFGIAYWGAAALLFLPGLAVSIRRLHDSGKSGWWFLILLIPLVGWIVFLVFMLLPSDEGTNRYGRPPDEVEQVRAFGKGGRQVGVGPARGADPANLNETDAALSRTEPNSVRPRPGHADEVASVTTRVRWVLYAGVALVLAGPVLLFFLGRFVLSHEALLLDHVAERRTTLVELSLWAGADPNYRDDEGRSALPVAVELGDPDIVLPLLDAGADPDGRTADGEPAASLAASAGDVPILAMLLDAGADPNARGESGIPVLVPAAIQGDTEIVRLLLDAGADPNTLAEQDLSVLAIAVDRGNTEVVRLLLEAGADPNGPGIAELVQKSGNADLLELLEAGALTAEALFTLAELGLNALANIDKFIEGMLCIFTLGFGC